MDRRLEVMIACMLSNHSAYRLRIRNVGYWVIIIYCAVNIVYSIIIITWFCATIVVNKDEYKTTWR